MRSKPDVRRYSHWAAAVSLSDAQLLHLAEPDRENVVVCRLVDVLERFAQQAVALLFAFGRDHRDFADVRRSAVGIAADRERAVVAVDFEPTARPAAHHRRQVPLAPLGRHAVQHRAA